MSNSQREIYALNVNKFSTYIFLIGFGLVKNYAMKGEGNREFVNSIYKFINNFCVPSYLGLIKVSNTFMLRHQTVLD